MPVYLLNEDLVFPPPEGASEDGIVAIGGDVSADRLLLAYSCGIFPWPVKGYPLLWFSPDPRFVLELSKLRVSKSLRKRTRNSEFEITADEAFTEVIDHCAHVRRKGQTGTWITPALRDGYVRLHQLGFAHSVEAWEDGKLVGGLYGVSLGNAFFGESMFAKSADASKVAFVTLCGQLLDWGFEFIDCQVYTDHLARFGAREWPRFHFLDRLRVALEEPTQRGNWELDLEPPTALERVLRPAVRQIA